MGKEGTKEKLDIELEAPADFTSPEVLYQDLVKTIHKYHPSDDISMIEKAYKVAARSPARLTKISSGSPESLISSILYVWLLFWLIWRWTRRPLQQDFCMT